MVEENVIENCGHTAGMFAVWVSIRLLDKRAVPTDLREDETGASADRGGVDKNIQRMNEDADWLRVMTYADVVAIGVVSG